MDENRDRVQVSYRRHQPRKACDNDRDAIEQDDAADSIQGRLAHARNCLSRFFGEGITAQDWNLFDLEDSFRVAYTGTNVSNLAQLVRLHLELRSLPANFLSLSLGEMSTSVPQMHDFGWHANGDTSVEMTMPEIARHYLYPPIRTLPQWTPAPESLPFSRDALADVSSFPAQEVRDALVKAYFDNVHPSFPIISQSAFMDCTHPLVAKDRHAVKSVLFRRASMLYHLRHATDRAQLIQAAFLFTWHVSDGDTVASGPWYWSGVAARVGCGLGAHRKSSVLPNWVSFMYRRCWWAAFISDVFSALETGRPCTVRAEDIDQVLMSVEEVTNLHLPGAVSSDLDPRLHFLNRMVQLALIGVDVLSTNAPARTEPVDVSKITTRLAVWALQGGLSTASTDHDDSLSCLLRIHYNLMLLYFHRALSTNTSSQEICAVSAHGILISFEKLAAMGYIAQCPFIGVGAAAAVGIQTVNDIRTTIGKGHHLLAIESINRLSRLLRLLQRLAEYWPNAESVLTIFSKAVQ
ncbi:hypothetical protein COCVIDRAFT_11691 [Bipolaris victoriae FI3]|uniref:Xylanolytic transcriptional activator regulatory domain-containing protein n=1 Tax=Bipolaris victoriae (strain FI3) TaxID=930091 RepID=W7EWB7_BIPV3|nr:hypothetical protein COCVIDRAFT_11691 [Bipolaris victoriae FI3]